jgi:hypothetical protein
MLSIDDETYVDYERNIIYFPGYSKEHIIDRRGNEFSKYLQYCKISVEVPDLIANSKKYSGSKVYILKNRKRRNFLAKHFVTIVDSNKIIVSAHFDAKLKSYENVREP